MERDRSIALDVSRARFVRLYSQQRPTRHSRHPTGHRKSSNNRNVNETRSISIRFLRTVYTRPTTWYERNNYANISASGRNRIRECRRRTSVRTFVSIAKTNCVKTALCARYRLSSYTRCIIVDITVGGSWAPTEESATLNMK